MDILSTRFGLSQMAVLLDTTSDTRYRMKFT
jgi:hypothetical protein